jgi:hypothetical protein
MITFQGLDSDTLQVLSVELDGLDRFYPEVRVLVKNNVASLAPESAMVAVLVVRGGNLYVSCPDEHGTSIGSLLMCMAWLATREAWLISTWIPAVIERAEQLTGRS